QPLIRLRPVQLRDRTLWPGYAGLLQRRQRSVVGEPQRLQVDPLLRDLIPDHRIVRARLPREPDETEHLPLQERGERETESAAFVQQRRHRDVPAVAGLAEHRLARHPYVGEEHFVEFRITRDLPQRPYLDSWRMHVHEQVRQSGVL